MSRRTKRARDRATEGIKTALGTILPASEQHVLLDTDNTPARVARMWREMLAGYTQKPPRLHLTPVAQAEMVVETGIAFTSLCAHHMVPFTGHAAIGYLPGRYLVGLSKLVRVLDYYARRIQLQERIGAQVAEHLVCYAEASAAFVLLRAEHQCMSCRGVRRPDVSTVTATFRPHDTPRAVVDEFYRLVEHGERK